MQVRNLVHQDHADTAKLGASKGVEHGLKAVAIVYGVTLQ